MHLLAQIRDALSLKRALADPWRLFAVTAAFSLAMPGSASIKALMLFALWGWLIVYEKRLRVHALLWFASVCCATVLACWVGIYRNFNPGLVENQALRVLTMFIILSVGLLLVNARQITTDRLDRLIFAIALIATVLKLIIVGSLTLGLASSEQIQARLGFESVQDAIGFGLLRLQFPSDICLQFMLACYVGGRRRWVDAVVLLAISMSVLLSFSRYLFAAYFVSLFLRSLLLRRVDFVSRSAAAITLAVIIAFFGALSARFVSAGTTESDTVRSYQVSQLSQAIVERPLLGSGMGASVHGYSRSPSLPFSYEVQWYALAMQFGLIGLSWFLLNLLAPFLLILQTFRQRFFFLAVWLVWAASGFTNPYIVSLGSAFGIAFLIIRLTRKPSPVAKRARQRMRGANMLVPAA